jgi:hypothetical protein
VNDACTEEQGTCNAIETRKSVPFPGNYYVTTFIGPAPLRRSRPPRSLRPHHALSPLSVDQSITQCKLGSDAGDEIRSVLPF